MRPTISRRLISRRLRLVYCKLHLGLLCFPLGLVHQMCRVQCQLSVSLLVTQRQLKPHCCSCLPCAISKRTTRLL